MANKIISLRNIKRALSLKPDSSTTYIISGRVGNFRPYKSFNFVDLSDGSSKNHLQAVIKRDLLKKPELGSYITCQGNLLSSPGSKQDVEFKVESIQFVGECNPLDYPLATTCRQPIDWYRQLPHLRPRAPHFASLMRMRSELELSLHMIMKQMDFFLVHTPSLTANDSEASSDLFVVKRSKMLNKQLDSTTKNDSATQRITLDEYFDKEVYLITSAQLHLESVVSSLSRAYTISTAFRAENSISTRHLCEFLMFEAEEANVTKLEPLMDRVESIIKFVGQYLSEVSEHKLDIDSLISDNQNKDIFSKLIYKSYIKMTYQEALQILKDKIKFQGPTEYGCDIGRIQEKKLLEFCNNVPIFIINYPKSLKPFYMKCDQSDKEALCFDLIAPHGGEICGGSLREDSFDKLIDNLNRHNFEEDDLKKFQWYLDSRRYGTFPHGGFGIGIERLVQSLLGIKNIKDTTAFPRWTGRCPM